MYALVESGTITKYFNNPKGFMLGDVQYSSDIFMKWSVEEKEAIGIHEVVYDNSNFKDEKWYINTNQSFDFANDVKSISGFDVPIAAVSTSEYFQQANLTSQASLNVKLEDIIELVSYELKSEQISHETSIFNCRLWDSMSQLNIIIAVATKYNVQVQPLDYAQLTSVELIYDFLKGK